MKILLLTWSGGENDPFTAFNETLREEFSKCGRETVIVKIDDLLIEKIEELKKIGVDFAITWQGIGIALKKPDAKLSIWDELKIPLFCLHGDHPSQMPDNHEASSAYVRHLYAASSFNKYANKNFDRSHSAMMFKSPILNTKKIQAKLSGDYFVLAKNLDDSLSTIDSWQKNYPAWLLNILMDCALAITDSLKKNQFTDHHELIDSVINDQHFNESIKKNMLIPNEKLIIQWIHQQLNYFYRNILSEQVLTELRDLPIMIYGRGWERYSNNASPKHQFHPPRFVNQSEDLFYSRWGIVDIAPSFDCLHDRTLRSIACQGSFLIGSNWPHANLIGESNSNLFFDSRPNSLLEHALKVIENPSLHNEKSISFGKNYQMWSSHFELLRTLELLRIQFN